MNNGHWRVRASAGLAMVSLVAASAVAPAAALADNGHVQCVNPGGTGGCFSSIQAAVDALPAGGRINIAPGTYAEGVSDGQQPLTMGAPGTPGKPLTLHGADAKATIIDGTGQNWALQVYGTSNVVIENLTFENATWGGVLLAKDSNVQFRDNHVTGNDKGLVFTAMGPSCPGNPFPVDAFDCGEAVTIAGLSNSVLENNLVNGNVGGILVSDEDQPTHDNLIKSNIVQNNVDDCGITLASHSTNQVYNNRVIGNTVSGNGAAGVGLFGPFPGTGVHDNLVLNNTLINNGIPGVTMHSHAPGQNMNGNSIIGNVISGNGADTEPGTVVVKTGIELFGASGANPIKNTTIRFNKITNEAIDMWFGVNAVSADVHLNSLGAPAIGIQNAGTGTINAQLNYWGCPTGPNTPGCSTTAGPNITTFPFLRAPIGRDR